MLDAAFLAACAPLVHPATMAEVIRVESGGNPLAIGINRYSGRRPSPRTAAKAAQEARRFIASGYRVDLGLAQITDRNLAPMGYTVEQMYEPCTNLRAGSLILAACYERAVRSVGEGRQALLSALSCYNTGDLSRGMSNGYVSRYVPALPAGASLEKAPVVAVRQAIPSEPPSWGGLVSGTWDAAATLPSNGQAMEVTWSFR